MCGFCFVFQPPTGLPASPTACFRAPTARNRRPTAKIPSPTAPKPDFSQKSGQNPKIFGFWHLQDTHVVHNFEKAMIFAWKRRPFKCESIKA
ncbi:MAG: CRISPR-associated protein Cas5 [Campylobacterales bacterium]